MLEILRHPYVRDGHAIGQIIEYAGPVVERLSVDERATMTNMAAEVGAFTGLVAADERTVEFLVGERGMDAARAGALVDGVHSDPGAGYVKVIEIDASRLRPMVALPGDPGNGLHIDELAEPVEIEIAYAGSCTAGKKEDMDMYARVFREAWEGAGRGVHPGVRCYIQCGSTDVREYARERGYLDLFPRDRGRVHRAGMRGVHRGRAGDHAHGRAGVGVVAEPELSGAVRAGAAVPGVAVFVAASAVAGRVVGGGGGVGAAMIGRCESSAVLPLAGGPASAAAPRKTQFNDPNTTPGSAPNSDPNLTPSPPPPPPPPPRSTPPRGAPHTPTPTSSPPATQQTTRRESCPAPAR